MVNLNAPTFSLLNNLKPQLMNWVIIIIAGVILIALVVFLVVKNQKDEKKFESQLNNDYSKRKDEENDIETDDRM